MASKAKTPEWKTIKIHPLSEVFPRMTAPELEDLGLDLMKTGQLEEIVILDGMVLDGWSRLTACLNVGAKPKWCHYNPEIHGGSPANYVWSKNVERRQLKPGMRAALGVSMIPFFQAEAELKGGGDTLKQVAEKVGVGRSTLAAASSLEKKDPEEFEKVKAGDVSLEQATKNAADKKVRKEAENREAQKALRDLKRKMKDDQIELHGTEWGEAFDKGVVLTTLSELEDWRALDSELQTKCVPLIVKKWKVKNAVKIMKGEVSGKDTLETLVLRYLGTNQEKPLSVDIDGYRISVRKIVEGEN